MNQYLKYSLFLLITLVSFFGGNSPYAQSSEASPEAPKEKFNITIKKEGQLEVTEGQEKGILKNIYEILLQSNRFNFILGTNKSNTSTYSDLFEVDISVTKEEMAGFYTIKLKLNDVVTGNLINFVRYPKIQDDKLQIKTRSALLKLFYGDNYDEVQDEILKDEIIPLTKRKLSAPKQKKNNSVKKNPKIEKSPEEVSEIPPESEEPPAPMISQAKPKAKKPKKKKRRKPKVKVKISNFDAPNIDLKKPKEKKKKVVALPEKWVSRFQMYFGNESETVLAETVVGVQTSTSRLTFGFDGAAAAEKSMHFYSYGGHVGIVRGDHELAFGPKYKLYGGYNIAPFGPIFSLGPMLSLDSFNFASVSDVGTGTSKFSNTAIWGGLKSEIFIDYGFLYLILNATYSKIFAGSTSYGDGSDVDMSGDKVNFSAKLKIYGDWGIKIQKETIVLLPTQDESIEVTDDSLGIFITYN